MPIRTIFSGLGGNTISVDRFLEQGFVIVKEVHAKLAELQAILDNLDDVTAVANSMESIETLVTHISDIEAVLVHVSEIEICADNVANVTTVADNLVLLGTVSEQITNLVTLRDELEDLIIQATNINNINDAPIAPRYKYNPRPLAAMPIPRLGEVSLEPFDFAGSQAWAPTTDYGSGWVFNNWHGSGSEGGNYTRAFAIAHMATQETFHLTGFDTSGVSTGWREILTQTSNVNANNITNGTLPSARLHSSLQSITGLTTAADKMIYTTASNVYGVTGLSAFGRTLIDSTDATSVRTTIGLNNVNNTSDANKPVSTATQTALDAKINSTGGTFTAAPIASRYRHNPNPVTAMPTPKLGEVSLEPFDFSGSQAWAPTTDYGSGWLFNNWYGSGSDAGNYSRAFAIAHMASQETTHITGFDTSGNATGWREILFKDDTTYARRGSQNTYTAKQFAAGTETGANAVGVSTGNLGAIEIQGTTGGAAMISFHRPAAYATYFGLDTDNKIKIGGWSMGANAHEVLHHGNAFYTGTVSTNTNYPIGSYVFAVGTAALARNATAAVYYHNTTTREFTLTAAGATVLAGTWRTRGQMSDHRVLMQRVA